MNDYHGAGRLDPRTAERLLDGAVSDVARDRGALRTEDVPPGPVGLRELLAAAAAPAAPEELAGEDAAVAAFVSARSAQAPRRARAYRPRVARFVTVKVAVASVVLAVGGGVAVAAGTGHLPGQEPTPAPTHRPPRIIDDRSYGPLRSSGPWSPPAPGTPPTSPTPRSKQDEGTDGKGKDGEKKTKEPKPKKSKKAKKPKKHEQNGDDGGPNQPGDMNDPAGPGGPKAPDQQNGPDQQNSGYGGAPSPTPDGNDGNGSSPSPDVAPTDQPSAKRAGAHPDRRQSDQGRGHNKAPHPRGKAH
ncbi:hypothetical protein [Actinomadura roseirufa]|uniref:hypothetical protein n=1 Tax=Actinomadura roseirufa TaxID=2094049 RepID=UPI0010414C93|nr:hypothetical protein [Actinomadura roseirufa]